VIFARRSAGEPDIDVRIRETLRDIRPLLHIEDADVSLVEFDASTGTATLRIEGDCPEGIGAHLRARVPEVKDVRRIANPTNE
jgi:Fe-S cluster biogenesis protein NfuA